jgi:hypothetical protein
MQDTLRISLRNPGLVPKATALIMLAILGMHSVSQAAPIATVTTNALIPLTAPQSGSDSSTTGSVGSYSSVSNTGNSAFASSAGAANDSFFAGRSSTSGTGTASSSYLRTFTVENVSGEARMYRLDSVITQGGLTINADNPNGATAVNSFQWKISSNGVQVALAGGELRLANGTTAYTGFGDVSLTNQSVNVGGSSGFVGWGSTNVGLNLGSIAANGSISIAVELLTYANSTFSSTSSVCGGNGYGYGYGYGDQLVNVPPTTLCYTPGGFSVTRFGDPSNGEFSGFTVTSVAAPSSVPVPASGLLLMMGLGITGLNNLKR